MSDDANSKVPHKFRASDLIIWPIVGLVLAGEGALRLWSKSADLAFWTVGHTVGWPFKALYGYEPIKRFVDYAVALPGRIKKGYNRFCENMTPRQAFWVNAATITTAIGAKAIVPWVILNGGVVGNAALFTLPKIKMLLYKAIFNAVKKSKENFQNLPSATKWGSWKTHGEFFVLKGLYVGLKGAAYGISQTLNYTIPGYTKLEQSVGNFIETKGPIIVNALKSAYKYAHDLYDQAKDNLRIARDKVKELAGRWRAYRAEQKGKLLGNLRKFRLFRWVERNVQIKKRTLTGADAATETPQKEQRQPTSGQPADKEKNSERDKPSTATKRSIVANLRRPSLERLWKAATGGVTTQSDTLYSEQHGLSKGLMRRLVRAQRPVQKAKPLQAARAQR